MKKNHKTWFLIGGAVIVLALAVIIGTRTGLKKGADTALPRVNQPAGYPAHPEQYETLEEFLAEGEPAEIDAYGQNVWEYRKGASYAEFFEAEADAQADAARQ